MGKIGATERKWLLTLHLLFSGLMLGEAFVFLILSITAANTNDVGVLQACYISMHVLSKTAVRYSVIFVIITGILLSVRTHWGLFKFYWIIAKEILTLLTVGLGPIGMYAWTLVHREQRRAVDGDYSPDPYSVRDTGAFRLQAVGTAKAKKATQSCLNKGRKETDRSSCSWFTAFPTNFILKKRRSGELLENGAHFLSLRAEDSEAEKVTYGQD